MKALLRPFALRRFLFVLPVLALLSAVPANAQQTGDISGTVTDADGNVAAGVSVEASSNVLPQNRVSTTAPNGQYRLRRLPPGAYTIEFSFPDGSTITRSATVLLQQNITVNVSAAAREEIVVTGSVLVPDAGLGSLSNAISSETVDAIPVGQQYRDLFKLIPGVQYSELEVRGPSAGGSGQDNVYQFDGVDVSLPLFGVLASEPSSHDIAQVSVVRGGAKAIGFNRAGGFLMNTVSKSGTNEFRAEIGYQIEPSGLTADQDGTASVSRFDEDRSWITVGVGGPIVRDHLFFYASYFGPDFERSNTANAYGPVPDFTNKRDEYFGKLTYAPTENILLEGSLRTSEREVSTESVGAFAAASTAEGSQADQDTLILEGSWLVDDRSTVSFKYTDFESINGGRPDTVLGFSPSIGDSLNLAALDTQGLFLVPSTTGGADPAFDAFAQPLIDQYGYSDGGVQTGGGEVGAGSSFNNQDFFRESFEIAYDRLFYIGDNTLDIHVGYQWQEIAEDLVRESNGWGVISAPGGTDVEFPDAFFLATLRGTSLGGFNTGSFDSIYSSSELQSFEVNAEYTVGAWTYNVGVMLSQDELFGQGLAPDPSNPLTGLTQSPGTRYKMYTVDWEDQIQPRLGVNWDYSDEASVYLNYARYNPAASSLARAASWDRNLNLIVDVVFDQNGAYVREEPRGSSSGKFFQEGLDPRYTNEYLIGWTKSYGGDLNVRAHYRFRDSRNFWEDTGNTSRLAADVPDGIPQELYIPNLDDVRAEIGGSSFVIARLDGSYTKYHEVSLEAEWTRDDWYLQGSYTWSQYYGNMDQDNTSSGNDAALFIGSSNIADGTGRQLWNFKEGRLAGDRRHQLKVFGFKELPWNARVGAYGVWQSGQPWETWDGGFYGFSNDTIRFSEPAGSREEPSHWQIDLNYTQNFQVFGDSNIRLRADIFNVFDNQTGYNFEPRVDFAGYGTARSLIRPRRVQLQLQYQFN